jgi:hypothetical protein
MALQILQEVQAGLDREKAMLTEVVVESQYISQASAAKPCYTIAAWWEAIISIQMNETPYSRVAPSEWRKAFGFKGTRAELKRQAKAHAMQNYTQGDKVDADAAEALCIAASRLPSEWRTHR